MRFGILLILMQSMLLCAEGRAESVGVQLDTADKVVRVLLQGDGEPPQLDQESAAAAERTTRTARFTPIASAAPPAAFPTSELRNAHTIRGPPARQ